MKRMTVGTNDNGRRLDRFLLKVTDGVPESAIYKVLRKKRIKVNGKRVTDGGFRISAGDELELYLEDAWFGQQHKQMWDSVPNRLRVVYEDAHIIIMNKPSGLLSQAEDGADCLENRMRGYLCRTGVFHPTEEQTFLPSLCHRIDRNTSGLVIGAKDGESLREMNRLIRTRKLRKFYRCELETEPSAQQGEIIGWMYKDEKSRKMLFSEKERPGAAKCHTRYRVLRGGVPAQVEAELLTGRTHQIRAGFAHIGCPLVGDVKYGAKRQKGYQHLHAARILFDAELGGCLDDLSGREFTCFERKEEL